MHCERHIQAIRDGVAARKAAEIAIAAIATVAFAARVYAGVIITGHSTREGIEHPQAQIVSIEGHRERIEAGTQVTIVDLDRGTVISINNSTRTYTEGMLKASAATARLSKPRFEPTGAQQTVAGYRCKVFKYSQTTVRGDLTVTGCFSTVVPGWKEYRDLNELLARRTGGESAESPPGLPLSMVTSLKRRYSLAPEIPAEKRAEMAQRLASQPPIVTEDVVTGIKTGKLRPSVFEVPAGYTKLHIAVPHD